jgi:hypothetical protein
MHNVAVCHSNVPGISVGCAASLEKWMQENLTEYCLINILQGKIEEKF